MSIPRCPSLCAIPGSGGYTAGSPLGPLWPRELTGDANTDTRGRPEPDPRLERIFPPRKEQRWEGVALTQPESNLPSPVGICPEKSHTRVHRCARHLIHRPQHSPTPPGDAPGSPRARCPGLRMPAGLTGNKLMAETPNPQELRVRGKAGHEEVSQSSTRLVSIRLLRMNGL